jgi:hypothetical protein
MARSERFLHTRLLESTRGKVGHPSHNRASQGSVPAYEKKKSSHQITGFYHLWVNENEDACWKSQEAATTTLIVMLAGFLAVTAGAGLVGAGLVGFFTGTMMDIICSCAYAVWIGSISRLI